MGKNFLEYLKSLSSKQFIEQTTQNDPEELEYLLDTMYGVQFNKRLSGIDKRLMDETTRYICICEEEDYRQMYRRLCHTFGAGA